MSSASSSGSTEPSASAPTCVNCRRRPAWTFSARNIGPAYQSLTGSCPRSSPASSAARTVPTVPSGRSVIERPARSSKENISLLTTSVVSPTPRANSPVSSKTGSSTGA